MQDFRQTDTTAEMILTLTENVSLTNPNFLFVFTHILTKMVVSFVKLSTDDQSAYPGRYNKFTINPSVTFQGAPEGEYLYTVYEQASATNTDPSLAGSAVEYGKLRLEPGTDFSYMKYDAPTSFSTYNG